MFKTDKESLERLSFRFDERDIANLKAILEDLKSDNLLTIPQNEVQRALDGLDAIGKLKLNGKIYAFHVEDDFAAERSGDGCGIELYLRQGDKLNEFYVFPSRDDVYQVFDAINFLKSQKILRIYTGQIPYDAGFLGLPRECDEEDPVTRDILEDEEIEDFKSNGIQVVVLDSLI
jgi:hypothetical protein